MARYIDADKLDFSPLKDDFDRARAKVIIMGQPTADVVEVVRCGKCKHWKNKRKGVLDEYVGECYNNDFPFHCEQRPIMKEDDFCSYGKKK